MKKNTQLEILNSKMGCSYMVKRKMLGCLYGQAIGDALGLGSEFMNKDEVRKNYPAGLTLYGIIDSFLMMKSKQ